MKAILLKKTGPPASMNISEVTDPHPGPGEVRVALQFAGINYAEILSRKGLYGWAVKRPYILGMEGSGHIDAVGEGVDIARVGAAVMVGTQYGCYAEKVVVPQERALAAFPHFSMAENAAFLVNYMTAWVSLFPMARLLPTEKVLITAAAGGVGTAAVQLASRHGSTVYGMAGSREKIELIRRLGATEGFNYREADCFAQLAAATGGVDVVLEMVGGEVFREGFELLNPFGRMSVAGFASLDLQKWNPFSWWRTVRDIPRAGLRKLAHKSVALMASHLGYLLDDPPRMQRLYAALQQFVVDNEIRPLISRTFPLSAAGEAHAFIESRQTTGKVLLQIDQTASA